MIVKGSSYKLDGKEHLSSTPCEALFTQDEWLNTYSFELELTDAELQRQSLDLEIKMFLQNLSGYRYTEITTLRFEKHPEGANLWDIAGMNIQFTK